MFIRKFSPAKQCIILCYLCFLHFSEKSFSIWKAPVMDMPWVKCRRVIISSSTDLKRRFAPHYSGFPQAFHTFRQNRPHFLWEFASEKHSCAVQRRCDQIRFAVSISQDVPFLALNSISSKVGCKPLDRRYL